MKQISLIFSTHHVDLDPVLAEYVHVMHQGEVIGEGIGEEIFDDTDLLNRARLDVPVLTGLITFLQVWGVQIHSEYRFEDVKSAICSHTA